MGGQAIKSAKHLQRTEFEPLKADILDKVKGIYPQAEPVKYYHQKTDFGDLDILVPKPKQDRKVFEQTLKDWNSQEVVYNGDVVSFEYQQFQIDLIFVSPEILEMAHFYYAYNDLSNLVGRMAHKFGLKFGWDGMTYQIRTESGHRSHKFLLSRNPQEIYTFLKLDYARWQTGFETLEDIFQFVVSSPYFNPELFSEQAENHIQRTRQRKRKTYHQFSQWLAEQTDLPSYDYQRDKSQYFVTIHNGFPEADFLGQLRDYALKQRVLSARQAKFNGKLVMQWTGLEGKAIGQAIHGFKLQYEDFDAYLDAHTDLEIAHDFKLSMK